jgi:hypothetical protein
MPSEGDSAHAQFSDREKALSAAKQNGKTDRQTVTCPKCGEEWQNLPRHLPSCNGGDDR